MLRLLSQLTGEDEVAASRLTVVWEGEEAQGRSKTMIQGLGAFPARGAGLVSSSKLDRPPTRVSGVAGAAEGLTRSMEMSTPLPQAKD